MTHYTPSINPILSTSISTDPAWIAQSQAATRVITGYATDRQPAVEIALLEIGNVMSNTADAYPVGFDTPWVAIARVPGTDAPLCAYEFYSAPADLYDPTQPGARLEGKMITVDSSHHGQDLAPGLLEALYQLGLQIAPGPQSTPAGAKLLNKLVARGVSVPPTGAITNPWPI